MRFRDRVVYRGSTAPRLASIGLSQAYRFGGSDPCSGLAAQPANLSPGIWF